MLASRLWKRLIRNGTLAGMLVGVTTLVPWKQYADSGMRQMVPGAFTASAINVVVSLLKRADSEDAQPGPAGPAYPASAGFLSARAWRHER